MNKRVREPYRPYSKKEEAEDREFRAKIQARLQAEHDAAIEDDEPHLDQDCDQDRHGGRLIPLDKLFKS